MKHYFAKSGDYGLAADVVVIDTDKWTSQDWNDFFAAERKKAQITAIRISAQYEED